jgi:hypothetical protein
MSECEKSVDFWVEELTKDTNLNHFDFSKSDFDYTTYTRNYGEWMWNCGYNEGLANLQTKVNTYCVSQGISHIKPKINWISVNDKLPKLFENVLTYDSDGEIRINWLEEIGDGNPYFAYGGETVTHWMLLPEPPKESDIE